MDIRHLTGRIDPVAPKKRPDQVQQPEKTQQGESFKEVLDRISGQDDRLQFSGHAVQRLEDRDIQLNETDVQRIEEAVERARNKGSQESLILDGDNAFIVNITNNTVVTAVDQLELRDKVFTQIDSAVLTNQNGQQA